MRCVGIINRLCSQRPKSYLHYAKSANCWDKILPAPRPFSTKPADLVLTEEDEHEIMFYSLRHSSPVTLRELYQFGVQAKKKQTILIAAQYLHEELPIRLAR
jgi:hypothetical protein